MSNLSLVRTFIADPIRYGVSESIGDGVTKGFQVPYAPLVPDSETVTIGDVPETAYDIDDALGLFSFHAAPVANATVAISVRYSLLSDIQINEIMALYSADTDLSGDDASIIKLTAADCLDIIASSEALILKRIKNLDLELDGPAVAKALREHAKTLREFVLEALNANDPSFDFAEQVYGTASWVEKVLKDIQRQG